MRAPLSVALASLHLFYLSAVTALTVHNLPGHSTYDTIAEVKRHLLLAPRADNDVIFSKSSKLDSSLDNFPLFKYTEKGRNGTSTTIEIICTKCYIKGDASASISANKTFNISTAAANLKTATNTTFHAIADYASKVISELTDYAGKTGSQFIDKAFHLENSDEIGPLHLPPPPIDFNINVGTLDDVSLEVVFKDTEIYVELALVLSAGLTYSLNLYTSEELGYEVGKVFVGFVATIDLILSVESQIEVDAGFHLKFDDEVSMKLALFAEEASHLTFHGGQFEFLPVTVATAGAVLRAVLRIGVKSGFSLSAGFGLDAEFFNKTSPFQIGAGIQASAYANAAEFITNITAPDISASIANHKCNLMLEQGYQMAIGAAAGASVEVLGNVWGPVPETEIPIFYTKFSTGCATTKTKTATTATSPPSSVAARDNAGAGSVVVTTATEVTYTALACKSVGMTNCPASLKSLSAIVVSTTLTTTVKSGQSFVWTSNAAQSTVANPVAFGSQAIRMTASSGKPTSYTPPPPPPPTATPSGKVNIEESINGSTGGVSNKLIIGLSVGLGVPFLAAIIAGIMFYRNRAAKRYGSVPTSSQGAREAESKEAPVSVQYSGAGGRY